MISKTENTDFSPHGLPAWIGSLPLDDHQKAVELMFEYTPDIPLWIQLPHFKKEGMIDQFLHGDVPLPGAQNNGARHDVRPMIGKAPAQLISRRRTWRRSRPRGAQRVRSRMVSLGMGTLS